MTENSIELTEHHVTRCDECALLSYNDKCSHPEADELWLWDIDKSAPPPEKCPLRARALLVKLVVKP